MNDKNSKKITYTITVEQKNGKTVLTRTNDGFDILQLMGVLEFVQLELAQLVSGQVKYEDIIRTVIEGKTT